MVSWLQGGAAQHASMLFGVACEFFAAWDGAAKPATLRSLVGGLAGGDGRRRSGLTLRFEPAGFTARYPANKLQRSGIRTLHSAG